MVLGKSYFTKLHIIRQNKVNVNQYIFDIDKEYKTIVNSIGGIVIDSINIFNIYEFDINENFLLFKSEELLTFFSRLIDLEENEKKVLLLNIIESYNDFGIFNDINSLYEKNLEGLILVDNLIKTRFPNLDYLISKTKGKLRLKFKEILNKFNYLNSEKSIDINKNIVLFNISNKNEILIEYYINLVHKIIKYTKKNSLIYFDEIWKCILKSELINNSIFELYKTIRKENAGIVTITQDIGDFFKNSNYGKSILNNSNLKMFFKIDFVDLDIFEKLKFFDKYDIKKITNLNKGNCLLSIQNNLLQLNINSIEYEHNLICKEEL